MPPVGLLKPTLALDFDDVLNTYASGFRPDYVPDPPVRGALEALESYAPVFQLVIFSTRAADPEGVSSILDWLGRNGFGAIPLTVTAEKPQAFAYLDDRGLNFPGPGQFPTVEELLSFHPWWEKSESSSFPEIDAATAATAVSSLMARAGAADNAITESLSRAVDLAGGYLDGLDDRLKTQSSLAAKLANVMLEKNLDLAAAAADVKDALRYSAVFAGERYVPASAVVLDLLERGAGLDLERLRNYWLPSEGGSRYAEGTYLGVNCVLRSPNGFVFELQFHTPQSLDVQQVNWDFYRLIRSGRLPPEDRGVVEAQMRQNNEFVPVPAAVGTLGGDVAATVSAAGPMAEPDRTDAERDIPADAHYRAAADLDRSCGTCSYFGAGTNFRCGMFDVLVSPEMVCDEWAEGLPGALPTQWTWDDLDEVSPPLVSAAPGVTSTSTMIAVKPRPEEAAAIADSEDGDPPADLHVTLAYLGELDGDLGPVADALRLVAAEFAPLEGVVGGSGRFDPPGVGILLPDVRGLVELRTAVCEALIAADLDYGRDHGFEAHITVDSDGTPDARGVGEELHFDDLLVVRGDSEVIAIPLTGAMPLTATALVAAGEPFCLPDELRGVTDPIRTAFVQAVMTPALEEAGLSWTLSNPLAAGVIAQAGQHIVGISQTTQNDVMNVIHYSHDQGLSIPDTAKAIRSHMREASNARATMIARTEMAGAVNGGSLAAAKIAVQTMGGGAPGSGGGTKTWHTAPGALYPRHEDYDDLDGQTVALDDEFQVGEDQLQFPGDPNGDPGEVINCVAEGSLVALPGLRAAMRRWYEGDLVRIRFASGDELAVTPNHPVLRADGCWTPARLLEEGDHCVCGRFVGDLAGQPEPEGMPAEVGEVYRLAEVVGDAERVRLAPPDLHGDGGDGEVDAVPVNRPLWLNVESASDEEVEEFGFAAADSARASLRRSNDPTLVRLAARTLGPRTTTSIVGGQEQESPLLERGLGHPQGHRLAATADRNLALAEVAGEDTSSDAVPLGQGQQTLSVEVELDEIVHVEVYSAWSGFVYNFDSGHGFYLTGSGGRVIARNCRCVLTYSGGSGDVAGENMDAAGERRDLLAAHNRRLVAAHARIDALEPKLVRALEPIFVRAGEVAARRFEALATNHLTAAGNWTPPAPEEILPINCEEATAGLAQSSVDAGQVSHSPAPELPIRSPMQAVANATSALDPSKADIDAALETIGRYVNAPGLPDADPAVTAKVVGQVEGGALGLFDPTDATITIKRLTDRKPVFTHEYGHALDSMIGNRELGDWYATQSLDGYDLRAWHDAIEATETYQKILGALNDAAEAARATPAGGLTRDSIVYVGDEAYTATQLVYVLDDQEIFARSFVQWMSLRDDDLAGHVEEQLAESHQKIGMWYWGADEFAPVADALTEFFRARGLLVG